MSTFSYAQAAKGQFKTTPAAPQSVSSQAASSTSSQSREATSNAAAPSDAPSMTSNEIDAPETFEKPQAPVEPATNSDEVTTEISNKECERTNGVAAVETVKTPAQRTETSTASTERRSRGPGSSSRASDTSEVRKPRKSKRTKNEKDSEPDQEEEKEPEPEAPKILLSEAPIPTVNIWVQRREAQAAKVKTPGAAAAGPLQANTSTPRPSTFGTTTSHHSEEKSKPSASQEFELSSTQNKGPVIAAKGDGQRKSSEASRDGNEASTRRTAPRGSRIVEKAEKPSAEPLAAVGDVTAWPTPETAVNEIKAHEKVDKPQEINESKEDAGPKERTKWVSMPYVPSVNFQTPLPPRGARGGRGGARGGRESTTRGSHAAAATSAERSQPNTSSRGTSNQQDRPHEGVASSRASSTTAYVTKRASVDAQNSRETRKSFVSTGAASATPVNGKDETHKLGADFIPTVISQTETQPNALNLGSAEHRSEGGHRAGDTFKNGAQAPLRDTAQPSNREGGNRERHRGGHRGRGGHGGANGHGHHSHNPFPLTSQPFPVPTHNGGRQNSYPTGYPPVVYGNPYATPNPVPNPRHSNRANSTSSVPFYGRPQPNGANGAARLPPIQTTNEPYDQSMHQPVSAFPAPSPYPHDLLPLVLTQVEYYFSVDNLCKDVFLRKNMDSQGFVRLEVIAGFKRMQDLTKDMELIRAACEESQMIDFVTGDDQRERVRARESWEMWVFPKGDRHESVNYDNGPSNFWVNDRRRFVPYAHTPYMYSPYGMESPAMFSPNSVNGIDPHYAQYMGGAPFNNGPINGVNGHASNESQLSATVPEFSPAGALRGVPTFTGKHHGDLHVGAQHQEQMNGLALGPSSKEFHPQANGVHENSLNQADPASLPLINGVNGSHEAAGH